jgi:hypothetical protein
MRRLVERAFLVVDMHSIYAPTQPQPQAQAPSSSSSSSTNGGGDCALLDTSVNGGDLEQAAIFKTDLPLLFSLLKLPASAPWWAECVRLVEGMLATAPVPVSMPVPDSEREDEGEGGLETTLNTSLLHGDADVLSYLDFTRMLRALGLEVLHSSKHTARPSPHTPICTGTNALYT